MNTNTDHKHRNDRGQENHRNESSWNRDTHGAQTVPPPPLKSHKMNSSAQSGFNPPPQGTRTVFADDPMIVDKLAHKRERERSPQRNSREASSSRSHREEERQDRHRRSAEPATKRMKREDTPIPGDFIPLFNDDSADEIDGLSSLSADRVPSPELVTSSSTLETEASKAKNERGPSALFDLGRSGIRALGNFISGGASGDATENDSSREQDALEAASLAQSELGHVAEQLRAAKEENQKLEEQASLLRADLRLSQEQVQRLAKKRTDNQIERSKLMEQATKDEKYIKQMEEELAKSRHEKTKHLERMQNLIQEKGVLHTQLKQLRNSCDTRPPKTVSRVSESSLNPFDNKLDQVSEAALKSGVESLNDSLETFTMKVIDDAELVALDNANARLSSVAPKEYDASNKLLAALNEHSHGEEKRGFLLDALLHQALIKELDHLFCSGDVLSHVLDENRLFVHALKELTKREPWTVAQRWRSLAASVDPLPTKWQNDSILECADSVVTLLAWAYHQPLETFQPMLTQIQSQLNKIYTEARQLSLSVRRDMLSVRMKVLVPASEGDDFLPFSSECMDAAWSDMKVVEGDAVVSPYKFGLQRTDDTGRSSLLIKPKAVTTALLRWLSCN